MDKPKPNPQNSWVRVTIFCNLMSDDYNVFNLIYFNYNLLHIFYFISNDYNLFVMPHFDYFDVNSYNL